MVFLLLSQLELAVVLGLASCAAAVLTFVLIRQQKRKAQAPFLRQARLWFSLGYGLLLLVLAGILWLLATT